MPSFSKMNYNPALLSYIQGALGMGFLGEIHFAVGAISGTTGHRQELEKWGVPAAHMYTTHVLAEDAATGDRNDVVVVMPGSYTQTAALTWDKSYTHMIGMSPTTRAGANRTRFGHSSNAMANMLTLSSTSAMLKDLYWMHGRASGGGADITCWTISGSRNVLDGCNAASPMGIAQAAASGYKGTIITGSQNYFKGSTFGVSNQALRTSASCILNIAGGVFNVYEDCLFISHAGATTPYFINWTAATGQYRCTSIFLNCQFINASRKDVLPMTVAILSTPTIADSDLLYFDNRCSFFGVTDLIVDGQEGVIGWGGAGSSPDASGIGDDKALGIGQNPESS